MSFHNNLRTLRKRKGLTQKELSSELQINLRTLQNYELGNCYPRNQRTAERIAEYFGISVATLFGPEDYLILQANLKPFEVKNTNAELGAIIAEIGGLFAGGHLSESDKDLVMKAMNDIYWESKFKSEKSLPKRDE